MPVSEIVGFNTILDHLLHGLFNHVILPMISPHLHDGVVNDQIRLNVRLLHQVQVVIIDCSGLESWHGFVRFAVGEI